MHGSWWFGISREYARAGELNRARAAMQRAVRINPSRIRRWPLFAASYLGDGVFSRVLSAYRATAQLASPRNVG
jgi:cytochrome c-type biogenesis protein CcmH/NrfG